MEDRERLFEKIMDAVEKTDGTGKRAAGIRRILSRYRISAKERMLRCNIGEMIDRYISAKRVDGLSNLTLENYRARLRVFGQKVQKHVARITVDDIRTYITYLEQERRLKRTTVSMDVTILKSFFGWLLREDIIRQNPCSRIQSVRFDKKNLRTPLSREELSHVKAACSTVRDKAIIELFYSTGCRLSELANINIEDIDFDDMSISVVGKGNKRRIVYFGSKARTLLNEYVHSSKRDGSALFTGMRMPHRRLGNRAIEKIVQRIGNRSGIGRQVYPHILRHSMATDAINCGMDIVSLQRLLGHEDISTTQIYFDMNQSLVKRAYAQFDSQI